MDKRQKDEVFPIKVETQDENPFTGDKATVRVYQGEKLIAEVNASVELGEFCPQGRQTFKKVVSFRRVR